MPKIPNKCFNCRGTNLETVHNGTDHNIECGDCFTINATGVDVVDGEIIATDNYQDWKE